MSAERLREAAALMRTHNPPCCGMGDVCCQGVTFHLAVADWLDRSADTYDALLPLGLSASDVDPFALAVARAYLGEAS